MRREFMTLIGGTAAWPLVGRAQEPGRTYHFGGLHSAPRDAPHQVVFFEELRRVGFVEGQNLTVDQAGFANYDGHLLLAEAVERFAPDPVGSRRTLASLAPGPLWFLQPEA